MRELIEFINQKDDEIDSLLFMYNRSGEWDAEDSAELAELCEQRNHMHKYLECRYRHEHGKRHRHSGLDTESAIAVAAATLLAEVEEEEAFTWLAQAIEYEIEAAEEYYQQWQGTNHQGLKAICSDKLIHAEVLLKMASEVERKEVAKAVNTLHSLKKKLTS